MKKILFAFSMIFALVSCVSEDLPLTNIPHEGDKVTLDFSVVIPEAGSTTRGTMASPSIESLVVVVFDENGRYVEAVNAAPVNGWDISKDPVEFTVTLSQSGTPRALHFVANKQASDFSYGTETSIMSSLTTTNSQDAYWQRVKVNSMMQGEEDTLNDQLTAVPLVRNFAKIVVAVNENVQNFEMTGYAVVYAPISGTVAPYNSATTQFQNFVNSGTTGLNYGEGDLADYKGFMPAGVQIDNTVPTAWSTNGVYTYESTYGNGTAVVIKGTYTSGNTATECYYKVDLAKRNADGTIENYNILRNICYTITINEVLGAGYTSAKVAMENTAGNNLSGSVDTKNLLNISDGTSRLFVEYVDKRIMNTNSFTLKYKYEPTLNGASANAFKTESNTTAYLTGVLNAKVGDTDANFITGWSVTKTDAGEGWSEITFTVNKDAFNNLGANDVLQGTFTISSNALSRTVRLYMLKPYTMTVSCNPTEVARSVGASVTINTHIPSSLPSDIFPLVFDIEAAELSIYPDPNFKNALDQAVTMPVKTGNTIIPGTPKNSFYFQRTLTEAEYKELDTDVNGYKIMPSGFLTNKAASASDVWVYNEFFGEAKKTRFENPKVTWVTELKLGNINAAHAYSNPQNPEYGWDYLETDNRDVTIYTKDGTNVSGTTTYSFDENGPRNNVTTITINGEHLNLTKEDYVYFKFTRTGMGGGTTTYYAYVKVSDLNADGANITLNFTTTNPL
ncbi:MAG: hypothetical protein IIX31_05880 [Alistipes sp.]|nr:hypothetical protein [Alistipes sp.]